MAGTRCLRCGRKADEECGLAGYPREIKQLGGFALLVENRSYSYGRTRKIVVTEKNSQAREVSPGHPIPR